MKPEDIVSDALAKLINRCPTLGRAWLSSILGNDALFSNAATLRKIFNSNPDIVLQDVHGKPRVYVEAKITAKTQPLQLLRARNSFSAVSGGHSRAVCLLCERRDEFPVGLSLTPHISWYQQITWQELVNLFRSVARNASEHSEIDHFCMVAKSNGALRGLRGQRQSALKSPSGHDYGVVYTQLSKALGEMSAVGAYGAGISPSLMIGKPTWNNFFGSSAVERIAIPYHLPKYGHPERYVFQLLVWDDNIYPGSREMVEPHERVDMLQQLSLKLGSKWHVGGRKHFDRVSGNPNKRIPKSAGEKLVGLINIESLTVAPPFVSVDQAANDVVDAVKWIADAIEECAGV